MGGGADWRGGGFALGPVMVAAAFTAILGLSRAAARVAG